MNIGQILETHLGWAAAHGVFGEDGDAASTEGPINAPNPRPVATPVFDGAPRRTSTRRS
jgi:DNA-directed RNA polymerase subunit beta